MVETDNCTSNNTSIKYPKGVFILAFFTLVTCLIAIKNLFTYNETIIFGLILEGFAFRVYYLTAIVLWILVAFGLFYLKRWAFFIFVANNIFDIAMFISNALFIDINKLVKIGWGNVDNPVTKYRTVMVGSVLICVISIVWILYYKNFFMTKKEAENGTGQE